MTVFYDISDFKHMIKQQNTSENKIREEQCSGQIIAVNFKNNEKQKNHNIKKSMYSEIIKSATFEDKIIEITSNAVASLLMSLEEDNVDSEHPLITYQMIPQIYEIVEKYVSNIKKMEENNY